MIQDPVDPVDLADSSLLRLAAALAGIWVLLTGWSHYLLAVLCIAGAWFCNCLDDLSNVPIALCWVPFGLRLYRGHREWMDGTVTSFLWTRVRWTRLVMLYLGILHLTACLISRTLNADLAYGPLIILAVYVSAISTQRPTVLAGSPATSPV